MTISIEEARQFYADVNDPVHDFDHILRVVHMAERLATEEGADPVIVQQAALLHDIGHGPGDHAVRAAEAAREVLADHDAAFVDAVCHAIEAHRYSNDIEPRTIEAKVVYDADKLDAIGAVGIARVFAYVGAFNQPLWKPIPREYTLTAADRDKSAYHEYRYKLQHISDRLYTDAARRIAGQRQAYMVDFFARLEAEINADA